MTYPWYSNKVDSKQVIHTVEDPGNTSNPYQLAATAYSTWSSLYTSPTGNFTVTCTAATGTADDIADCGVMQRDGSMSGFQMASWSAAVRDGAGVVNEAGRDCRAIPLSFLVSPFLPVHGFHSSLHYECRPVVGLLAAGTRVSKFCRCAAFGIALVAASHLHLSTCYCDAIAEQYRQHRTCLPAIPPSCRSTARQDGLVFHDAGLGAATGNRGAPAVS